MNNVAKCEFQHLIFRQLKRFSTQRLSIFTWESLRKMKLVLELGNQPFISSYFPNMLHKRYANQRVTSYELISLGNAFIARVTIYFLHTSYGLPFIAQVMSYFLHTSYKLLFILQVTSYFYCTSYELLLLHELWVTVYCTSYELLFTYQLRMAVYCMNHFLTMSYNKDKDDKAVYDNKLLIKN